MPYAWFSERASQEVGYSEWKKSDGREVVVTHVSDDEPVGVKPGTRHAPEDYHWDDAIYQGEVVYFQKSFPRFIQGA